MSKRPSTLSARKVIALAAAASLALAACGGDDDEDAGNDAGAASTAESDSGNDAGGDNGDDGGDGDDGDDGNDDAGGGGGGGGTLVLGDETITLDSARCFLQEQDAAAGGGKILFVAQGFGVDAAGDDVIVDVSRYDQDSQFAGDDILVDIGDPFAGDSVGWSARGPEGTVELDGSNLSADDLTFQNSDDLSEAPGSLEINC